MGQIVPDSDANQFAQRGSASAGGREAGEKLSMVAPAVSGGKGLSRNVLRGGEGLLAMVSKVMEMTLGISLKWCYVDARSLLRLQCHCVPHEEKAGSKGCKGIEVTVEPRRSIFYDD